jgi:hypothetical protein
VDWEVVELVVVILDHLQELQEQQILVLVVVVDIGPPQLAHILAVLAVPALSLSDT